jgi:UDPglucose 6-dehydrogenase
MVRITIIGAGTVGQANGMGLMDMGHEVTFVDINPRVVTNLRRKNFKAYLANEIYNSELESNISVFCVPTPFNKNLVIGKTKNHNNAGNYNHNNVNGQLDLSFIISSVRRHAMWLGAKQKRIGFERRGRGISIKHHNYNYDHLVVVRSTIPPGTTRNLLIPLIQSNSGMKVGDEIGLCMQPEFLRTVSSQGDFMNPRATVIGQFDKMSGDILEHLFSDFGGQIFRTDIETAEFVKYVQNSFNATKITFANEMWLLGQNLGIDANFALHIASKVGEGFWNPGYGIVGGRPYDGVCLPKDIKGFLNFAKERGINTPLLSAVDLVNSAMNNTYRTTKDRKKYGQDIKSNNPALTKNYTTNKAN